MPFVLAKLGWVVRTEGAHSPDETEDRHTVLRVMLAPAHVRIGGDDLVANAAHDEERVRVHISRPSFPARVSCLSLV